MGTAIGIDIGGTFVDIVMHDGGVLRTLKVPSIPHALAKGVVGGLEQLIKSRSLLPASVRRITHGSTVVTNALLQGKWAKTALITTRGFRDVLEIGRQDRPVLYNFFFERPQPIVPRDLRFEVEERIDAEGTILRPLQTEEVDALILRLKATDVETVAVCLLFSFINPDHERAIETQLNSALHLPITLSSDLIPEFREYERTATTVVNAALRPVVEGYLTALEDRAKALGLSAAWRMMQSGGEISRAAHAQKEPVRMLLSGPAAGVEGARSLGELAGMSDLITLDMGGTSCDVSLIQDGIVQRTTTGKVGAYPVALPMVDIHTIGAGGGSIAWIDRGDALRVGPRSAGAVPGPACYGQGGKEATVTDAHLVLGHLLPDYPLGGLPALHFEAAKEALKEIAAPFHLTCEAAALGILEVADAAMERAIRVISLERGHDPRRFALLAFGGAGPLHAVSIARRLGISKVLIPAIAGVLSAYGLLVAETGYNFSQGLVRPLREVDLSTLKASFFDLEQRGAAELLADGVAEDKMAFYRSVDLRYLGQAHELTLLLPDEQIDSSFVERVEEAFHAAHRQRYGHAAGGESVELVAIRLRAVAPPERIEPLSISDVARRQDQTTYAWFSDTGPLETRVISRPKIRQGQTLYGPAIVTGEDATVLLPPDTQAWADRYGNLVVETG
jgi:N-methylhydantoinase A